MDGGTQGPIRQPQTQAAPQPIHLSRGPQIDPKEGVVMKRTMNRLLARLAMFVVAIILGAIAVAQAHKGLDKRRQAESAELQPMAAAATDSTEQQFTAPIPYNTDSSTAATLANNGAASYSDEYAASAPDPGFDEAPVSYTETPAYQNAVEQPTDSYAQDSYEAAPAYAQQVSDTYAQPDPGYEAAPSYGEYQQPAADYQQPAAEYQQPAPVQNVAMEYGNDQYDYNQSTDATGANYAAPTTPAGYDAQPVQYTDAQQTEVQETNSGFGQPAPMTISTPEPDYIPAQTVAPTEMPSQTPDPGYQDVNNYNQGTDSYGSASVAFGESRTRQVPSYDASGTPAFSDTTVASSNPSSFSAAGDSYATGDSYAAGGVIGMGKPGPRELEGTQTPSLTLFKESPPEVQVGKPAKFTVTVKNVGSIAAHDVLIRDEIPHGTRLIDTSPSASQTADGALLWEMGTLEAGSQASATMEVMPMEEGEIGSVATVSFQASASAKSISTRPQLTLEHTTDSKILVGDDVIFRIKLTNAGTGAATGVIVEEDVPDGLRHFEGRELEFEIGTLRPQESRILELKLKADQPKQVTNVLVARADGDIVVSDQANFEIVAPSLQVAIQGPQKRYLERQATHTIAIANPGTAAAKNVSLVARLPRGLKFVNTNNAGQYDSGAHAVRWRLDELPAQEMGKVELTTSPTEIGEHRIEVSTKADMNLEAMAEHEIFVDGLAALLFTVTDVSDPIEVGGETTYEIHVVNQGSKTASNLRVLAAIPAGMQAINGEGPTRVVIEGQRVMFDPLARLAPQSDSFYKIHVKGVAAGDQRIKVLMTSDELREPVTKEESTHVYADN